MASRTSRWGLTPRQSIELECERRGRNEVVDGCLALLEVPPKVDDTLVVALAGPAAHRVLNGESRAEVEPWLRVWALRGLLWAWDERAIATLGSALSDPAWRVREMALKVVRRHLVGEQLSAAAQLREDPIPRVRTIAADTVERLVAAGA